MNLRNISFLSSCLHISSNLSPINQSLQHRSESGQISRVLDSLVSDSEESAHHIHYDNVANRAHERYPRVLDQEITLIFVQFRELQWRFGNGIEDSADEPDKDDVQEEKSPANMAREQ